MEKECKHPPYAGEKLRPKSAACRVACWLLLLFMAPSVMAQQEQTFTVSFKASTLEEVFNYLSRHSDYVFTYNSADLRQSPARVTRDFKDAPLRTILTECLRDTDFTFEFVDRHVVITKRAAATQNSVTVKGFVYDEKKQPLPGVTVQVAGTTVGTATTANGWFSIVLPMLKGKLKLSFVGYQEQEVEFSENTDTLQIYMKEEISDLDEVVVRAYGSQKKREMISAISSITAEEIKDVPAASIATLLQGRLAGTNVIMQSGAPGSAAVIAVRGFNSLLVDGASDGQPLWVVDGVPMHSFVSPVTGTNTLADLDPSMIESIQVLKDAAAASIYGSRAGNGVILVTTKKGKAGEAQFAANVSYSVSQLMEYPEQTGGRMERWMDLQYYKNIKESYYDFMTYLYYFPTSYNGIYGQMMGTYDKFWGNGAKENAYLNYALQDSLDPYYNNCENWWKHIFRTGYVVNANIQASGGTERFRYMIGLGYYDEKGISINSGYSRANLLSNFSAQFTKNLRLDTRVYLAYINKSINNNGSNKYEGIAADPTTQNTYIGASDELKEEWLENVNGVKDRTDDYRAMVSAFLEYETRWGLSASVSGNVDFSQNNANQFTPSALDPTYHENSSDGTIARSVLLSVEGLLHYNRSFNESHNVDLLFGINANKEQSFSIAGSGRGGGSDDVYYYTPVGNGVTNHGDEESPNYVSLTSYSSSFTEKRMLSFFGRVGYNYKQRYLLEFTYRRDGSSTFGEGNRWANFPSIAVGWTFSEEPFIKSWAGGWLNWGKIRGSYGTSGQVFSDAYLAHGLMYSTNETLMGQVGMVASEPISPDLTWEKTEQYDLGLDMDMFNYRLNVKLDYYYKYTKSLIYKVPLPGGLYPFSERTENAMAVSNEGLELELQADITRDRDLAWRMKFNIARNWNRFEKSYTGKDIDGLVIGRPLSGLYVYAHEGYYESEDEVPVYYLQNGSATYWGGTTVKSEASGQVGNYKLKDFDGDNYADTYYAGSTLPLAHGGWVNELTWKGFDLNLLVNYAIGRKIINGRHSMGFYFMKPVAKMFDYRDFHPWTGPGCDANAPALGNEIQALLDSNIEKVNQMTLKQVTLGYNLPDKIANSVKLKGIRCFVTIENLFYWSNYSGENPEIIDIYKGLDYGRQYPLPRKWTLGLTFNF